MEHASPLTWADAGATLLMLLVVLAVIIGLAAVVRRLNMRLPGANGPIKIVTSTSLGPKERLVIVEVGEQKLLLGVTASHIELLQTLPDDFKVNENQQLSGSFLSGTASQVLAAVRRDRNQNHR